MTTPISNPETNSKLRAPRTAGHGLGYYLTWGVVALAAASYIGALLLKPEWLEQRMELPFIKQESNQGTRSLSKALAELKQLKNEVRTLEAELAGKKAGGGKPKALPLVKPAPKPANIEGAEVNPLKVKKVTVTNLQRKTPPAAAASTPAATAAIAAKTPKQPAPTATSPAATAANAIASKFATAGKTATQGKKPAQKTAQKTGTTTAQVAARVIAPVPVPPAEPAAPVVPNASQRIPTWQETMKTAAKSPVTQAAENKVKNAATAVAAETQTAANAEATKQALNGVKLLNPSRPRTAATTLPPLPTRSTKRVSETKQRLAQAATSRVSVPVVDAFGGPAKVKTAPQGPAPAKPFKTAVAPAKTVRIETGSITPPPVISFGVANVTRAAPPRRFAIHLNSGPTIQGLRQNWLALSNRYGPSFTGLTPRYTTLGTGNDKHYRLIAGTIGSKAEAVALCARLTSDGLRCRVSTNTGRKM